MLNKFQFNFHQDCFKYCFFKDVKADQLMDSVNVKIDWGSKSYKKIGAQNNTYLYSLKKL